MIKIFNNLLIIYNKVFYSIISVIKKFIIKHEVKSVLKKNFRKGKPFYFVQVGANDGVSFDFLYEFIIERDSKGIVIEPIKEYFDELVLNYQKFPDIIKVNKAIHPTEKSLPIYKINPSSKSKYPDWVKGIASFNPNHHIKLNIESQDIVSEQVECDSLLNIVDGLANIDYFQIDTEGFDFEVLKMIDFIKLQPKIVKYEHFSLSNSDRIEAQKLLTSYGYYLFNEFNDTIAISIKKIKL
jgi:FkbM family methyltransferase